MVDKNYYLILGLPFGATPEEIKSAYRQKAKELHPDYYGDDCAPFRDIQEAYECLSDPQQRQAYDDLMARQQRSMTAWREMRAEPLRTRRCPVEPLVPTEPRGSSGRGSRERFYSSSSDPALGQMWGHFDVPGWARAEQAQRLHIEVPLTAHQARHGGSVRLVLPVEVTCPVCRGWGDIGFYTCRQCSGAGVIASEQSLAISFRGGISDGASAEVSLDEWGRPREHLVLHFRVRG
jgi:molecular chaperone DnaJ